MDISLDREQLKASDEASQIEQLSNVKMVLLSHSQSSILWRKNFDAVVVFENTAAQLSRERATLEFESAIDSLAKDTSNSHKLVTWCINVQQFDYEIIKTDEAMVSWTNREQTAATLNKFLAKSTGSRFIQERQENTRMVVTAKSNTINRMKRKQDTVSARY
ncbi:hypothetical protein MBANPS3_007801 [Mucor bainieri]